MKYNEILFKLKDTEDKEMTNLVYKIHTTYNKPLKESIVFYLA